MTSRAHSSHAPRDVVLPWWRRFRRGTLLLWGGTLLIAVVLAVLVIQQYRLLHGFSAPVAATDAAGNDVRVLSGLPVISVHGDAAQRGTAHGSLLKPQIEHMMSVVGYAQLRMRNAGRGFTISDDDRREMTALAQAAGVDAGRLITANAMADSMCTALVVAPDATRPLMVARNMDFALCDVLGPATTLQVVRGAGARTYASIGWPGAVSVISGLNDAGLSGCVLLNLAGGRQHDDGGEPIGLRLRAILASDTTVEGACARFAAGRVASTHYVVFADATSASVVWRVGDQMQRNDLAGGWLTASNGARNGARACDARGTCMDDLIAHSSTATLDSQWLRRALTAIYLEQLNAQAMLIVPAQQRIELAVAGDGIAASLRPYLGLDLAAILRSGKLDDLHPQPITPVAALPRYDR